MWGDLFPLFLRCDMAPNAAEVVASSCCHVDKHLVTSVNVALIVASLFAPLLSEELVAAPSEALLKALPTMGRFVARCIQTTAAACERLRVRHERAFVLAHGAITYACGDILAQTAMAPASVGRSSRSSRLLPGRTLSAAAIGVLSDTLPFYYWGTLMQSLGSQSSLVQRSKLLTRRPSLLLPLKIVIHLATFQPASTAAYLLLQGARHAGSLVGAIEFLRAKFSAAILPALATFTIGGPLIHSHFGGPTPTLTLT